MLSCDRAEDDAAAHSTTIAFAQYDDFMIYESYYDSKWFMALLVIARGFLRNDKNNDSSLPITGKCD